MERYIIIGYAALLAIVFEATANKTGAEIAPQGNMTGTKLHPVYNDSRKGTGTEKVPLNLMSRFHKNQL
jgi:hypothetical protein